MSQPDPARVAASKHEPPLFRMLLDKVTGIVYVWRGKWTAVTRRA